MKSPRFEARSLPIRTLFTAGRLEWTWKKKVRYDIRDQIFRDLIEHLDFHANRKAECKRLADQVCSGTYAPSPPMRLLLEKSKGLCRQMVVPRVHDALVLQCLSDSLYPELQKNAPTKQAFYQPKDHSFSKKKLTKDESGKIDGYGTLEAWLDFQQEAFKFSKTFKFVIITDIANYYDTISYSQLRNTIAGMVGVKESILDLLIFALSGLLWQPDYMPRVETGLPQMDLDAPRLLAHCFLFELDEYLKSQSTEFARFMDDINAGVDSIPRAKRVLRDVDLILQTRGVRLNSGKTRILTQSEAATHFRVLENGELDILEEELAEKVKKGESIIDDGKNIASLISTGLQRNSFADGNGDKILKRYLGICIKHRFPLSTDDIRKIVRLSPSCRERAFAHLSVFPLNKERANVFSQLLVDPYLVDDAAQIALANSLVSTRVLSSAYHNEIDDMVASLYPKGVFGFCSAIALSSKYHEPKPLLASLRARRNVWQPSYHAGRQVGALAPLFFGSPYWNEYEALVVNSRNDGASETFDFHRLMRSNKAVFFDILPTLKKANPSKGTRINHSKFLVLMSAFQGTVITAPLNQMLVKAHSEVWLDSYYRRIARASAGLQNLTQVAAKSP